MKKILVVDDDRDFCSIISQLLRDEDYRVNVVYSGEAALKKIEREHFDSMLLDYNLPRTKGLDILDKIKQAKYPLEVIMISGSMDALLKEKALKKGAHKILDKPFRFEDLIARLRYMLKDKNHESKKVYT